MSSGSGSPHLPRQEVTLEKCSLQNDSARIQSGSSALPRKSSDEDDLVMGMIIKSITDCRGDPPMPARSYDEPDGSPLLTIWQPTQNPKAATRTYAHRRSVFQPPCG